jgi:dipeptidyl aminopeptidase/acylaminoacyl peptidase
VWWYERLELLSNRSPLAHVRRDWTPLHIDHGVLDEEVPFLQSVQLYQSLRFAGAEVRLVAYPREWHDYVEEAHRINVIQRCL